MSFAESFRRSPIHMGPIVGAVSTTDARVWLRTRWPSTFRVECLGKSGERIASQDVGTDEATDCTGVARVEGLEPDTAYGYSLVVDSVPYASEDFNFRTAPIATRRFSFAFGSCYRPLVVKNGVMAQLYQACCQDSPSRPSFLLAIGDQIYADQSGVHGADWKAATFDEFCEIYQKTWSADSHFMKSLARCPTFMIFDDHEVENAWFKLRRKIGALRGVSGEQRLDNALRAYECYQNSFNPEPISETLPYTYKFSWGGVEFFIIDARYQRQTNFWHELFPYHRDILGPSQFEELKKWLLEYRNSLKFIITSVPISHIGVQLPFLAPFPLLNRLAQVDQWPGFSWGRRRLISFIRNNDIPRVVFLAGDVHISHYLEFSPKSRGKRFYQFTCSPFANDTRAARIQKWFLADHIRGYRKNLLSLNFFEDSCFGLVNLEAHDGEYRVSYSVIDERGGSFPMSPELII
jgi:alkaline phosphatase D